MGKTLIDQFSILHFSTGVIAYFWGISFVNFLILHTIFEILENTKKGVYFIDTYLKIWPGGKKSSDNLINSIGDTIFAIIGFIISKYLDKHYKQYK